MDVVITLCGILCPLVEGLFWIITFYTVGNWFRFIPDISFYKEKKGFPLNEYPLGSVVTMFASVIDGDNPPVIKMSRHHRDDIR